ncbi:MAG: hypothetical protein JXA54_07685 [Candidatus Heimdallarchaeota archaeon]|nr:hypothetical protein [Candidatus Heimdallarchaeota archaeon]
MAKTNIYGLIVEIFASLIGVAMIVVGIILYPPSTDLVTFLIFIIGGGLFVLCGIILIIFDIKKKKEAEV